MKESEIRRLDDGTVELLRSTTAIACLRHCIEELVLNSIDAGASRIEIGFNVHRQCCEVADNGHGIELTALKKWIGVQRYVSSKLDGSVEQLDKDGVSTFGFRGEALASLGHVSELDIVSRSDKEWDTWHKTVRGGVVKKNERSSNNRIPGTTVRVSDLFFNQPVRFRHLTQHRSRQERVQEKESIVKLLKIVSIMHPSVEMIVRESKTSTSGGEILFRSRISTHSSRGSLSHENERVDQWRLAFSRLFGQECANQLVQCCEDSCNTTKDARQAGFRVVGYLSDPTQPNYPTKDLQFLYVNGRVIENTVFHSMINAIYKKFWSDTRMQMDDLRGISKTRGSSSTMYHSRRRYPMFILNIECHPAQIDVTFDSRKTMVLFQDEDVLEFVVSSLTQKFLDSYHPSNDMMLSEKEQKVEHMNHTIKKDKHDHPNPVEYEGWNVQKSSCRRSVLNHSDGITDDAPQPVPKRLRAEEVTANVLSLFKTVASRSSVSFRANVEQLVEQPEYSRTGPLTGFTAVPVFRSMKSVKKTITKDMISRMEVIAQVDKKFILTQVDGLICAIDQHAADERIRLEQFESQFFQENHTERAVKDNNIVPVPNPDLVTTVGHQEPITFRPSDQLELQRFRNFQKSHLLPWGWHVELESSFAAGDHLQHTTSKIVTNYEQKFMESDSGSGGCTGALQTEIKILKSPVVLGVKLGLDDLRSFVLELAENGGQISTIPAVFKRVLDFKSCRGAIMFGDYLSPLECRRLVEQLSQCTIPFQCAHGRPSMTVIFSLL